MKAHNILRKSAQHIEDRAAARDQAEGERSMARTVAAFNALTGHQLSERDGWMFMVQLKAARACSTPTGIPDDYEDGASYFALAGECAASNDNAKLAAHVANVEIAVQGGKVFTIPFGFHWIAQDKGGQWWAFNVRPQVSGDAIWSVEYVLNGQSKYLGETKPREDWRDTLRKVR